MNASIRISPLWAITLWFSAGPLNGQKEISLGWNFSIPDPLSDGTPSEPPTKPAPISFKVLNSHTKRVHVTEAPEMADLPPVQGVINITVQRVEDPGLPAPPLPAPIPATSSDDSAVSEQIEELEETYGDSFMIMLSATVYNHSRTLVTVSATGTSEGEVVAWSNLDFNHFSAFSSFTVKEPSGVVHNHSLLMGIGNEEELQPDSEKTQIPNLPDLATGGPSFSIIEGGTHRDAVKILTQLHDLYRNEGVRLEAAFHASNKAHAGRKASVLANPPVPEDVTIQVWKRDVPLSQSKPGGVR
jgi:hypothetical protein